MEAFGSSIAFIFLNGTLFLCMVLKAREHTQDVVFGFFGTNRSCKRDIGVRAPHLFATVSSGEEKTHGYWLPRLAQMMNRDVLSA